VIAVKKLALLALIIMYLAACGKSPGPGQIYLYGEMHGVEAIMDKEFELWYDYYHKEGMRHLFIEYAYYTAEYLNIWMQSDNDAILDKLYNEWKGAPSHTPCVKEFYKKIKTECPETVFHSADVGHQHFSTGQRYLIYLRQHNLKDSDQYLLTQEAISQGMEFYANDNGVYRENKMVENFIREFDKLNGESVMGIFGAAHTGLDALNFFSGSVPSMANQLKERYGDAVHSEDLREESEIAKMYTEPIRADTITLLGKDYVASYFGERDLTSFSKEYLKREYWRLENAYDDFKDMPKTGDVLPYSNYPTSIEVGQVFVIDYTKTDGSIVRMYLRSDGCIWNNMPSTEEFTIE